MTALLNALERAQTVGWRGVALTGSVAVVLLGLISAARMQPAPVAVAAALTEEMVPVVMAAVDIEEGTILTMEMIQQRQMPAFYVTSSIIRPDSASYIIGQRLNVPVQKGDAMLWTQFEQMGQNKPALVAKQDLDVGTVLTAAMFEEKQMPEAVVTSSVVKPDSVEHVLGHPVSVGIQKGDLILWTHVGSQTLDAPGSLSKDDVMNAVVAHHQQLAACVATGKKEGDLRLGWSVAADGVPYDVAPIGTEYADDPATKCIVKALAGWKFPKRKEPTLHIDFPIRFAR